MNSSNSEMSISVDPMVHNETGKRFIALSFGMAGGIMTSSVMIPYTDMETLNTFSNNLYEMITKAGIHLSVAQDD